MRFRSCDTLGVVSLDLSKTESLRPLFDCQQQLLPQFLLGVVCRKVQLIEASVGSRKFVAVTISFVDRESLSPSHTLKIREPIQGNLVCE